MKNIFLHIILFAVLAVCASEAKAQFWYEPERNRNEAIWEENNGLYLNWYNNNFFKNNEYFLSTASGYTLFGMQHIPSLLYKFNEHIFVQGGAYLKKDLGTSGFVNIAPYYLVSLQNNGYSLSFGNINANIGHRMYDPLFANERLMTHHLEEGFSLKVDKKKIYSETWINWEKQQYAFSDFDEQFTVGHSSDVKLYDNKKFSVSIPVQALAIHSGGQLDTTANPTTTLFNLAAGLNSERKWDKNKNGINMIGLNVNYLLYRDLAANSGLAYSEGSAMYANLNIKMFRYFLATVGYWHSDQFIAPKGDILYQSVSAKPTDPEHLEPQRRMLQLGLAYEKNVAEYCNLSLRAMPFYDFGNSRLDYWYSLNLTLQPNVRLLKKHAK